MELSQYERETIISYNEANRTATVYTHNRALLRKLKTLAVERPGECQQRRGIEFSVPKTWIHVRPPRVQSEAQRAASMASLQKAHFALNTPRGRDVPDHE